MSEIPRYCWTSPQLQQSDITMPRESSFCCRPRSRRHSRWPYAPDRGAAGSPSPRVSGASNPGDGDPAASTAHKANDYTNDFSGERRRSCSPWAWWVSDPRCCCWTSPQPGIRHQHHAQGQQLLLPPRETAGIVIRLMREIEAPQDLHGPCLDAPLARGDGGRPQEEIEEPLADITPRAHHHVLQHRQPPGEARDLEAPPDAMGRDQIRPAEGDGPVVQADRAAVRELDAGDDIDQRRFARAIGPDDPHDAPRCCGQADTAERAEAAEGDLDVSDRQHGRASWIRRSGPGAGRGRPAPGPGRSSPAADWR